MWLRRLLSRLGSRADSPLPRAPSGEVGRDGEDLAGRLLREQGLRILARNYRCPAGETDFVALDESTLKTHGAATIVFVEVKTRRSDHWTDPASAVDEDKRRRLRNVARYYCAGRPADLRCRFDIVSIVAPRGQPPRATHIPGAFC